MGFEAEQTSHHILYECPVLGPPGDGNVDLTNLTPETINWTGYKSYMKLPRFHSIAHHTKEEEATIIMNTMKWNSKMEL